MGHRELMLACEENNYTAIKNAGWLDVYLALRDWWAKRFELKDFAPYLDVLRDDPPAAAQQAVDRLRGEKWRPMPSMVYREVAEAAAREQEIANSRRSLTQKRRKDQQPATLQRVRWLLEEQGAKACECIPHPVEVKVDQYHVLRCPTCGGIEQGQVYDSEDLLP